MTAVVGIGNELMRDDGVGIHALRALAASTLPPGVELVDGGTSPDAAFLVQDHDRVIVIDAAYGGGPPGTIYRFRCDDIDRASGCASSHDAGLVSELRVLTSDVSQEIVVIGVEPEEVACGMELSPCVQSVLSEVVTAVRREIASGGEDAHH
jgi:hydrogenase maturation protease